MWEMFQSWFCLHTMGQTLSEPNTEKVTSSFDNHLFLVGVSSMQGWRTGILVVVIVFVVSQCFVVALWVLIMCLQSSVTSDITSVTPDILKGTGKLWGSCYHAQQPINKTEYSKLSITTLPHLDSWRKGMPKVILEWNAIKLNMWTFKPHWAVMLYVVRRGRTLKESLG